MQYKTEFNKDNLDAYLLKLAKEYKRLSKSKVHAEIIWIGGASIIINYGFRDMTNDIDALIHASSDMKQAINNVGDELGLNNGWLNEDFKITNSYSSKLTEYSIFYKTFDHIIDVRTVKKEYLVAMKLMSFRKYKSDISDIIGILISEREKGNELSLDDIKKALINLYGKNYKLSKDAELFLEEVFNCKDLELFYESKKDLERDLRNNLIDINRDDGSLNESNIEEVIKLLEKKNKD